MGGKIRKSKDFIPFIAQNAFTQFSQNGKNPSYSSLSDDIRVVDQGPLALANFWVIAKGIHPYHIKNSINLKHLRKGIFRTIEPGHLENLVETAPEDISRRYTVSISDDFNIHNIMGIFKIIYYRYVTKNEDVCGVNCYNSSNHT